MSTQQMQMRMNEQQVPVSQTMYPHGQTLPANALQSIVTTGQHHVHHPLPVTSQMQQPIVNVSHPQAMSMSHLPNNIELNMNMSTGMTQIPVNHNTTYVPQQVNHIQQVPQSQPMNQQQQIPSQPSSVSSTTIPIQSVNTMNNQNYPNQHQTINSGNIVTVPYSMPMQQPQTTYEAIVVNSVNPTNLNMVRMLK